MLNKNRNRTKVCEYCGSEFTPTRITRRYCQDTCKQYAYLKRNGLVLPGEQVNTLVSDHTVNALEETTERAVVQEEVATQEGPTSHQPSITDTHSAIDPVDANKIAEQWVNKQLKQILEMDLEAPATKRTIGEVREFSQTIVRLITDLAPSLKQLGKGCRWLSILKLLYERHKNKILVKCDEFGPPESKVRYILPEQYQIRYREVLEELNKSSVIAT